MLLKKTLHHLFNSVTGFLILLIIAGSWFFDEVDARSEVAGSEEEVQFYFKKQLPAPSKVDAIETGADHIPTSLKQKFETPEFENQDVNPDSSILQDTGFQEPDVQKADLQETDIQRAELAIQVGLFRELLSLDSISEQDFLQLMLDQGWYLMEHSEKGDPDTGVRRTHSARVQGLTLSASFWLYPGEKTSLQRIRIKRTGEGTLEELKDFLNLTQPPDISGGFLPGAMNQLTVRVLENRYLMWVGQSQVDSSLSAGGPKQEGNLLTLEANIHL